LCGVTTAVLAGIERRDLAAKLDRILRRENVGSRVMPSAVSAGCANVMMSR
jgi:hypothetical protein